MKRFFLSGLLLILLAACSTPVVTQTDLPASTVVGEEQPYPVPYPIPTQELYVPPYPITPEPGAAVVSGEFNLPSPGSETGVVSGRLLNKDTKEPLPDQTIYLGKKVPANNGSDYTYTIQERSSPHTFSTKDGWFAIGDVIPGNYIIMIWTPSQVYVIPGLDGEPELEITVEAGEMLDLGELLAPQL